MNDVKQARRMVVLLMFSPFSYLKGLLHVVPVNLEFTENSLLWLAQKKFCPLGN